MEQFKTSYNEEYIEQFLDHYMIDNEFVASRVLDYDCDDDMVLMVVYCVILAVDKNFIVELNDNIIDHKKFKLRDFVIRRREN